MIGLLLVGFIAVMAIKYYTSVQMQKMERRIGALKADVREYRDRLQETLDRLRDIRREEQAMEERFRFSTDLLEDLNFRLTASEPRRVTDVVAP